MINIILPIVENVEGFDECIKFMAKKDVAIYVGITESLAKNFSNKKVKEIHVFADKTKKEEIINSLHSCKMERGKILIVRRPLTETEYTKLINSNKDIVTLNAKRNGFVQAMRNFASRIIKRVFAFSFFQDISAVCLGENMFELLSVCENLSMASRINKYVGLEMEEFETDTKPVKKDYNRFLNVLKFVLYFLILGGSVAGGVLVCIYTPLHVLTVVAVIFWIILALMIFMVGLVNFTRAIIVGELYYGRGEEKEILKVKGAKNK